jgi:hypothetical protein
MRALLVAPLALAALTFSVFTAAQAEPTEVVVRVIGKDSVGA